jgi:hypothetical protein
MSAGRSGDERCRRHWRNSFSRPVIRQVHSRRVLAFSTARFSTVRLALVSAKPLSARMWSCILSCRHKRTWPIAMRPASQGYRPSLKSNYRLCQGRRVTPRRRRLARCWAGVPTSRCPSSNSFRTQVGHRPRSPTCQQATFAGGRV